MEELIKLENISLEFNQKNQVVKVLDSINLKVKETELLVVLGPSGAGKSSLLRLVSGLHMPSEGKISFSNNSKGDGGTRFGFVFQDPRLLPWRKVTDNVRFGLDILNIRKNKQQETAQHNLELVGLPDLGQRWPAQLSGGQKQRVAIARALAPDPDVLLFDEPFGSLDLITRTALQEELVTIRNTTGKTIIFVTHDIDEALLLADRIILLAGSPATIKKEYSIGRQHPRTIDDPFLLALSKQIRTDLWKFRERLYRDSFTSSML